MIERMYRRPYQRIRCEGERSDMNSGERSREEQTRRWIKKEGQKHINKLAGTRHALYTHLEEG